MKFKNKHIIIFQIAFLIAINLSYGQHIKAPMDIQIKIIPKVLSLDKNFSTRKDSEYNLGIIYSSKQRNSVKIKKHFEDVTNERNMVVKKKKVNIMFIDIADINMVNIKKFLKDRGIDVVYLTPLRGFDIGSFSKICKEEKILSVTGVLDFMKDDISVSFDIQDKKLQIIINNNAAKNEGANFSSRLLRIAKLI
jgi:hypothetical protein